MKLKKCIVCLICIIVLVTMYGCKSKELYSYAINNIAEVREVMFEGSNSNIKANLISGEREKEYVVNGYTTPRVDFGVLTFTILNDVTMPETVNYVLTVGTTRFDGVLEHNPYNDTYVVDIKQKVKTDSNVFAKIIAGEFVESVELKLVTFEWSVDCYDALKLAVNELESELKSFVEDEQFCGECYIKILNDDEVEGGYYWYVNFVSKSDKNLAVIVSPISSEILAKKTL